MQHKSDVSKLFSRSTLEHLRWKDQSCSIGRKFSWNY